MKCVNSEIKSIVIVANQAQSLINFRSKLIEALISNNCHISVVIPNTSKIEEIETIQSLGCHCVMVPMWATGMNPFKDLVTLWALYKKINIIKPDVVLAYTIKPVIYGLLAARFARIKKRVALITGLGSMFLSDSWKGRGLLFFIKILHRLALRHAKAVIFQNPDDKELFLKNKIALSKQVHVVNGSGVDLQRFGYQPVLEQESITFLMLSRLLKDKGIYEFVEAARILKRKWPGKLSIVLAGGVYDNPSAIQLHEVQQWVTEGVLEHLGHLQDVRAVIKRSSVYVLPSFYREGVPRSILEALSVGRPIVTTNEPGCRETVIEGKNGFLVEAKSVSSLVEAMERFITHPELILQMGLESRKIAEEKYDVNKVNLDMLKIMGISGAN